MVSSSRLPDECPICGYHFPIATSTSGENLPCRQCGQSLWFSSSGEFAPIVVPSWNAVDLQPTVLSCDIKITYEVIERLPESIARENLVLPVADTVDALIVAATNPRDVETAAKLRFILNREIRFVHVTEGWLRKQIPKHYEF